MNDTTTGDAVVQEITIAATADRIFDAVTDPQERLNWWGRTEQAKTTQFDSDLRPGGSYLMNVIGGGGRFTIRGTYREIVRPSLVSFTFLPSWEPTPTETLVRFDIIERGNECLVRVTHTGIPSEEARKNYKTGWGMNLRWLNEYVDETKG
ncbi:MAG: SRPBCC family protein [Candidatus Tyrphobacter sp.]